MGDPANPDNPADAAQARASRLGEAPAFAAGTLMEATAQSLSVAVHNSASAQQQAWITLQATTTQAVSTLFSLDTAAAAEWIKRALGQDGGAGTRVTTPPGAI